MAFAGEASSNGAKSYKKKACYSFLYSGSKSYALSKRKKGIFSLTSKCVSLCVKTVKRTPGIKEFERKLRQRFGAIARCGRLKAKYKY
jgi:hypothetical protein